jgi:hypothetical protein
MRPYLINAVSALFHYASFLTIGGLYIFTDLIDIPAPSTLSYGNFFVDPPIYSTSQMRSRNVGWMIPCAFLFAAVYRSIALVFNRYYCSVVLVHGIHIVSIFEAGVVRSIAVALVMITAGYRDIIGLFLISIMVFLPSLAFLIGELNTDGLYESAGHKLGWRNNNGVYASVVSLILAMVVIVTMTGVYIWEVTLSTHYIRHVFPFLFFFAMMALFLSSTAMGLAYTMHNIAATSRNENYSNLRYTRLYGVISFFSVQVPLWLIAGGVIQRNYNL